MAVSIHAPRAERDRFFHEQTEGYDRFQSTRPARGATVALKAEGVGLIVSIHAPRTGRDALSDTQRLMLRVVSIHAPRAGRDYIIS